MALNTRIVLKNDELAAWEGSSLVLKKGEIALAKRTDGSYDLRVGDGVHVWKELSNSFALSAAQVIGLESTITSLSTSFYEKGTYDELTALTGVTNGSIGVVKETVVTDDGTVSSDIRTGYVYDSASGKWQQLNGNYKADQVYFTDDMTITYKFGKYDIPDTGSKVLSCKGVSVQDFLKDALAEKKNPTVTKPTFTFTTSNLTGEIGASYDKPDATLTMTGVGSYTYGPDTGIKVAVGNADLSCVTTNETASNTAAMVKNSTVKIETAGTSTFLSTVTTYDFRAEATWEQGAMPKTNIGTDYTAGQIASDTSVLTCAATATGYLPAFYVVTTSVQAVPTAISASTSKDENGVAYTKVLNDYAKTKFTDPDGWYQIFYVTPASKNSKTSWSGTDSSSGLPVNPVPTKTAEVTLLDGSKVEYKVFIVQNGAKGDAGTATMVYA